ncbi:MAG: FAD-binding oxidoreductase [Vicinamibacterales bacterium]
MIETDPDIVRSFLSDAAHVPGGFAAGVAFPRTVEEVASLVASAETVLPIGAQSSLTGGATPRGGLVLSTRSLTGILLDQQHRRVRVGAGVPLSTLQAHLATRQLWYPPAPTYDGAFVGGVVSTNAAGAATFKFGTTRRWVEALTVVLADGRVLSVSRGDSIAVGHDLRLDAGGTTVHLPVPTYRMPDVPKLSAGYFAAPGMDLLDLFVGSEGTLGVIVDVVLRVIPRPSRCTALVECVDDAQAFAVTRALRERATQAWHGDGVLDVSAIEYMDARSLAFVADAAFAAAGTRRPPDSAVLLLVQFDATDQVDEAMTAFSDVLDGAGVSTDPVVALPGDAAATANLFALREAVPAGVNAAVAAAKQRTPLLQKTAGDFIVPFERLAESVALYRRAFEAHSLDYAIWGHVSDGNLHPNVVPATADDMERGNQVLRELARTVIAMGGSPLAEHGVGRSTLKQEFLRQLYGDVGIDQMRRLKRSLDPGWKLAPGVLFPA